MNRNHDRQLGYRGVEHPDYYIEDEPEEVHQCEICHYEPVTEWDEEAGVWICKNCINEIDKYT